MAVSQDVEPMALKLYSDGYTHATQLGGQWRWLQSHLRKRIKRHENTKIPARHLNMNNCIQISQKHDAIRLLAQELYKRNACEALRSKPNGQMLKSRTQ